MGNDRHIYNRLKSWLALRHITNRRLAEHLRVSEQTVSKWCTNYSQPSVPDLYRIAEFLEIEVSELLEPVKKK